MSSSHVTNSESALLTAGEEAALIQFTDVQAKQKKLVSHIKQSKANKDMDLDSSGILAKICISRKHNSSYLPESALHAQI